MTVYLIGDSVSACFEPYTRAALPEAEIVSPSENCRSSHDVLEHIGQWTEDDAVETLSTSTAVYTTSAIIKVVMSRWLI